MNISPGMEILLRMAMHRVQQDVIELFDEGLDREGIAQYFGGPTPSPGVYRAVGGLITAHEAKKAVPPLTDEQVATLAERKAEREKVEAARKERAAKVTEKRRAEERKQMAEADAWNALSPQERADILARERWEKEHQRPKLPAMKVETLHVPRD